MILKALYDYYNRCDNLPAPGMEEKQIGFIIVIDTDGHFVRIEDCRIDKNTAKTFLVKKSVGRSSAPVANYLYDNSAYVIGYSEKNNGKDQLYFDTFKEKVISIASLHPDNQDMQSLLAFYQLTRDEIFHAVETDPLWNDVKRNLSKKYSVFSFRINGDTKIIAEKKELIPHENTHNSDYTDGLCLVTGEHNSIVETTTATMIPGSQATAKLVAFQIKSGYDSYGKEKGRNAPISENAEFAYTTALNALLAHNSRNKSIIGGRTFLFWASSNNDACRSIESSFYDMFGFSEIQNDDPNAKIEQVRKVFKSIYSGVLKTTSEDKFYILGLAPNAARIAVVYWAEIALKDFAGMILRHFDDMEIIDTRKEKRPYMGIREILSAVTLGGKQSDAAPNLPDAIAKSIFNGIPYPYTLLSACIRRIKAEISGNNNPIWTSRAGIIKAYLNRTNDNNQKIQIMLDKENNNLGYLCGRLFAVLDDIQYTANKQCSIRSSYMNSASSTPSVAFGRIMSLSNAHIKKIANEKPGLAHYFEEKKGEIINLISPYGFPAHLSLEDQGRFFVGYYHQKNHKEEKEAIE